MKQISELLDTEEDSPTSSNKNTWPNYNCEFCGQHIEQFLFNFCSFFYGLIFLFGKESGYFGFTCVNCKKTNLFIGSRTKIETIHTNLLWMSSYFPSVNYSPSQFPELKNYDVKCSGHILKSTWAKKRNPHYSENNSHSSREEAKRLQDIDKRPDLRQNYLCSGLDQIEKYTNSFLGYLLTLWWFKEDEISKLLDLENSSNLRIFPRHVSAKYEDFEAIENYCWKHKLYLEFLHQYLQVSPITNKEIRSNYPIFLDTYRDSPNKSYGQFFMEDYIIPIDQIKETITKQEERQKIDLSQTAELAQILVTPKSCWWLLPQRGIQTSIEICNEIIDLFQSKNNAEAIKAEVPDDTEKWKQEKVKFNEMSQTVSENFHQGYVQDFLVENHEPFVSAYSKLAKTQNFTYATILKLKEDLLSRLYSHILENERDTLAVNKNLQDRNTSSNLSGNSPIASDLEKKMEKLKDKMSAFKDIISEDPKIYKILREISVLASEKFNMGFLIEGETGTGKELFAKAIHAASPYRKEKRVRVNCGAIPPNLFESTMFGIRKETSGTSATENAPGKLKLAHQNTIFFDEVGDFPLEQQQKLLRTLQEGEIEPVGGDTEKINSMFIFATHMNLMEKVKHGEIREDFYYRISSALPWTIPPLRERRMDIPLLLKHFIEIYTEKFRMKKVSVSEECLHILTNYHWPGNVRQLENQIARIICILIKI